MATHVTWKNDTAEAGGFGGSLLLHAAIVGVIIAGAVIHPHTEHWGDNTSTAGAIQASMVSALPLPPTQRFLDKAVLASDTPSAAPVTAKEITQPPPKPDEVPIASKKIIAKVAPTPTPVAVRHPQPVPLQPTKATTGETAGIQIQQAMAVQNGTASIAMQDHAFGSRFAYYVDIVFRKVAQNWHAQEADSHSSNGKRVTLLFDIDRDGAPQNVRVETKSGSPTLDTSAMHALQRVDGFGPLPGSANRVTVEYSFDYQQQ